MSARKSTRAQEPTRGEHFTEKRTKHCAAGSSYAKTSLAARPNCNVRSGVEEVVLVAERVNVGDTDDCRYGCTLRESACVKTNGPHPNSNHHLAIEVNGRTFENHLMDLHGSH